MAVRHRPVFRLIQSTGQHICRQAVLRGVEVVSLSRRGIPPPLSPEQRGGGYPGWMNRVNWVAGDSLNPSTYREHLTSCDAVVHSVGQLLDSATYKSLLEGTGPNLSNPAETAAAAAQFAGKVVKGGVEKVVGGLSAVASAGATGGIAGMGKAAAAAAFGQGASTGTFGSESEVDRANRDTAIVLARAFAEVLAARQIPTPSPSPSSPSSSTTDSPTDTINTTSTTTPPPSPPTIPPAFLYVSAAEVVPRFLRIPGLISDRYYTSKREAEVLVREIGNKGVGSGKAFRTVVFRPGLNRLGHVASETLSRLPSMLPTPLSSAASNATARAERMCAPTGGQTGGGLFNIAPPLRAEIIGDAVVSSVLDGTCEGVFEVADIERLGDM
ncbi:hypothetical protein HK102_013868 [Quaeritorhiza haematococci]|nr:hypothetical protein HK102_013868 [Quaeritorhiza haematococci]